MSWAKDEVRWTPHPPAVSERRWPLQKVLQTEALLWALPTQDGKGSSATCQPGSRRRPGPSGQTQQDGLAHAALWRVGEEPAPSPLVPLASRGLQGVEWEQVVVGGRGEVELLAGGVVVARAAQPQRPLKVQQLPHKVEIG